MCETPAYRRLSPAAAGQHAISSDSNPSPAAQAATCSSVRFGNAAEEAELQRWTSIQAPFAADSAIASQSRISSCPSAKVGKSGSAGIAPASTAR